MTILPEKPTQLLTRPSSGPTSKSPTQRQRIVELLRARGAAGVTTADFLRMPVARYSSRIRELRQIGFVIRLDRIAESLFRYTLISSPAVPKSLPTFEPKPREAFTPSLFPPATGTDGRP